MSRGERIAFLVVVVALAGILAVVVVDSYLEDVEFRRGDEARRARSVLPVVSPNVPAPPLAPTSVPRIEAPAGTLPTVDDPPAGKARAPMIVTYDQGIETGPVHMIPVALGDRVRPIPPRLHATTMLPAGLAFPLFYGQDRKRVNIQLLTNCQIPPSVWNDPAFLNSIGASGGSFPVAIYRIRENFYSKVETIRLPARSCALAQYYVRGAAWERGDVVLIGYTPGLLVAPSKLGTIDIIAVPFASEIENVSNDPVTLFPTYLHVEWR